MITAEKLALLINFGTGALANCLASSGYTGASFKTAKFLGITNGGQFCYAVTFHDEDGAGETKGKVFLTYKPEIDQIVAEY